MTDLLGNILELTQKVQNQETQICVLLARIKELERLQRESMNIDGRPSEVSRRTVGGGREEAAWKEAVAWRQEGGERQDVVWS